MACTDLAYIYSTVMVQGSSEEKLVGGLEPPIVGMMIKAPILGKLIPANQNFIFSPTRLGMMIQSDELIFFRGVVIPPTRKVLEITLVSESGYFLDPGRTAVCVPTYHASNKTDGTWSLLLAIAGQDVPEASRGTKAW